MTIQEIIFRQLKSAFVPLLKRVIALIPTKASDLTNDEGFISMPDVTQATKVSTPSLNLNMEPTFLVSEESSVGGGAGQPNAGNTTYSLRRYSLSVLQTLVSGGTDILNVPTATEITEDDNLVIVQNAGMSNEAVKQVNVGELVDYLSEALEIGEAEPFFTVTGDLNIATMQVSNLSASFSDAMAAVNDGKPVKINLVYSIAGVSEVVSSEINIFGSTYLRAHPLLVANFGSGLMPYLFRFEWQEGGMTLTPYPLVVQS